MIDIHSHILPGVDDGASDLDEALLMCRLAAEDGCAGIVATPHLRHESWPNMDRRRLEALWRQLREAVGDLLEIHLGGEIAIHSESFEEIFRLPEGGLLPLAGSRYLLLELHTWAELSPAPESVVHELTVAGWRAIIAHPERIPWLAFDLPRLAALVEQGAMMQLTAMSVTGELGNRIRSVTDAMLDADLVHFVSSDAHDVRLRPPGLRAAYRRVADSHGVAVAEKLFRIHPQAVLEDRPLSRYAAVGASPATAPRK